MAPLDAATDASARQDFAAARVGKVFRTFRPSRLEGDIYHCFWLGHGRFIRVEDHLTAKGALNALGLKRRNPRSRWASE